MKPATEHFYGQAVHRAIERVGSSLDRALDLEQLAREAAISPFHFHRIFRGMVGETPLALHRRLRLERAAFALLDGERAVVELAFAAGYETHESFTRAFKGHYGLPPLEFRERWRHLRNESSDDLSPWGVALASRSGIHYQPEAGVVTTAFSFRQGETMEVKIKTMPELRVATVRHIGPYDRISEAFTRLHEIAGPTGLQQADSEMVALYHDDPESVSPAELRSDAALTVAEGATVPEGLGESRLPSGSYACTVHRGPYDTLGDSWARLMGEWLPQSGKRLGGGVSFELYRNTPMDTEPQNLLTELYVQLTD